MLLAIPAQSIHSDHIPCKIRHSALFYPTAMGHRTGIEIMYYEDASASDTSVLTSRSHSALSTFSSKLVSTKVSSPTDPLGRTAADKVLSRHLELLDRVGDSALERGGEEDFVGVRGEAAGISRDSRE